MEKQKVCAELAFILEQVPYSYIKLLPDNFIDKLKEKMSLDWYKNFKSDKVFYNQEFSDTTIEMLENIYKEYWCKD